VFTVQSWIAIAAFVLALVALVRAKRASRRLDRLTESYWELRYEYTELRAGIARLESPEAVAAPKDASPQPGATNFVPLSSLKR
jgi:hypothetical protein